MPVDLEQEFIDRYGEDYTIQITNDDAAASTVNTTRMTKCITDAKAALYNVTGRKFEYDGITQELLDIQTSQVVALMMWVFEAYQNGQTLEMDARYKAWRESVDTARDVNEMPMPLTNAPVTETDTSTPPGEQAPAFNDSSFDDYIPDNDSGGTRDPW